MSRVGWGREVVYVGIDSAASELVEEQPSMALSHHSLIAWQRADDLFIKLHQLSLKAFPASEKFELGSQLRRAAFSVAANIVEGFAQPNRRARLNFLHIAQASLAEVGYCVHAGSRLGYITESARNELETEIKQVGAPLAGLIRSSIQSSCRAQPSRPTRPI